MRKQTKLWKMKNGEKIRICDMEDSHLLNTIKLLQRHASLFRNVEIKRMINLPSFLEPSGDGAVDAFDRAFDSLLDSSWEDFTPEIYDSLVADAERRDMDIPIRGGDE